VKKLGAVIGAVALIAAAWMFGPALAASLTSASAGVGSGKSAVARCDTTGVTTVYGLNTTNVTSVVVSNIDSACGGETMKITVSNGLTTSAGTGTVPAGGGSLPISVTSIAMTQAMHDEIVVG